MPNPTHVERLATPRFTKDDAVRPQPEAIANHVALGHFALSLGVGFFLAVIVAKSPILEVIVLGVLLVRTVSSVAKLQRHYQKAVTLEAPYHATLQLIADAGREG